jgi:hypothetical protein
LNNYKETAGDTHEQVRQYKGIAYIRRMNSSHVRINGVRNRDLKQHLLMGATGSINVALNQVLNQEAAKAAAGPPASCEK